MLSFCKTSPKFSVVRPLPDFLEGSFKDISKTQFFQGVASAAENSMKRGFYRGIEIHARGDLARDRDIEVVERVFGAYGNLPRGHGVTSESDPQISGENIGFAKNGRIIVSLTLEDFLLILPWRGHVNQVDQQYVGNTYPMRGF